MPAKPIPSGLRTVKTSEQSEHLWVIILAGGEGTRMRPLIHKWLGEDRPKQYCTFVGSRSMLQHTVDRALTLVDSAHILVVSMGGQRVFLNDITIAQPDATPLNGQLLEQPIDCGTGAAVLLGAAHVLSQDPDATLLILPSDHFFHPEERFQQYADLCMQYAERTPDRMVLLGATPHYAETDYGWIVPSLGEVREDWGSRSHTPLAVSRFHEKPDRERALGYLRNGGLWNTMVVGTRAKVLWEIARHCRPDIMDQFQCLLQILRLSREGFGTKWLISEALHTIYQSFGTIDFSRDILQKTFDSTWTLPMTDMSWSDWGRPERIVRTLDSLGKKPLFPLELLDSDGTEHTQWPLLLAYAGNPTQQQA
jgi:mannose-1-phosphate guanylyltransferase